ncbi:MAG: Asp-tRNA(Asn)/Glu-tRNA(Gln) amidotransferase subunit GatA [Acidobacteria bacterium]|nr:Asp-tRNA(Asn)/Glu-tRNA(Gln) amidotransferase subunit GatA [Acidobacteriota bacterium]
MSLADVGALIRSKEVSPVEVTRQALQRIEELNPRLNAFLTVTAELAEEQARAAEAEIQKGEYRGPLHGVPVSFKDLLYTQGVRTTAGSKILANFVPDSDATVVEKMKEAGAVLVGKNAMHEFAYGITNDNPHYGPTRNPWNSEHTSGGSSGGSGVAVAAGMAFAALGTDTGGSIRIPASFNGIVGLKPTFGRVSLHNAYPLGYTLDHVGPLARTVVDAGVVYQTIAGFDSQDPFSVDQPLGEIGLRKSLNGLRVGVPEDYFFDGLQPDVEHAVREALRVFHNLGARVVPLELSGMAELTEASRISLLVEALVVHRKDLEQRANDLGQDVKALLEKGREVSAEEYMKAQLARSRFRRQLEQLFQQVDVLVTPSTPLTAFPIGQTKVVLGGKEDDARIASTRLLRGFNASGHPALSVPCGFDSHGLPVGLQIVGRLWDEATILHAGYAYEQATEWHKRRPPEL